jgi:hypothetical protein
MGQVVAVRELTARFGVKPPRPGKSHRAGKPVYIGVNIYISPEANSRLQTVKRNVLHGILSAWGWHLTRHLYRNILVTGGVFRIRCRASDALDITEQVELRLPDLLVRRVRVAA